MTSFTAPDERRFMYKSVPMGLSVASAAMLKVLLHVFSGKNTHIGLYTYMDDILLAASDWETHLDNLQNMFEILKENSLTFNPEKCDIAFFKLEFLGREYP